MAVVAPGLGCVGFPRESAPPFVLSPVDNPWPVDVRRRPNFDGRWRVGSGLVCVTSAASYVGLAIVRCLVNRGYSVRALIDNQEDLEKLRGVESASVAGTTVDMMDSESLSAAFDGAAAVFHTSSFIDPGGISGYTRQMAKMEAAVSETVVAACARTATVRKCILTSSLLACVWQPEGSLDGAVADERCWSDEALCRERKLWFALGKTMMERSAWKAARGRDVRLVSICPGLVTGLGFSYQSPSTSMAYLKGGSEMYVRGTLATVDVEKVAKAHVLACEAPNSAGRYICFEDVVEEREEAVRLERLLGLPSQTLNISRSGGGEHVRLSNEKMSRLAMSMALRCSLESYNWTTAA